FCFRTHPAGFSLSSEARGNARGWGVWARESPPFPALARAFLHSSPSPEWGGQSRASATGGVTPLRAPFEDRMRARAGFLGSQISTRPPSASTLACRLHTSEHSNPTRRALPRAALAWK